MKMDYLDIKNRFAHKKILVIGDVVLDRYSKGSVFISPEAPIHSINVESEEYKAGGAGNVAINVSNLSTGSEVYFFSFVGKDEEGSHLRQFLSENKVRYFLDDDKHTIVKHRFIGTSHGRPQQIFRADWENNSIKLFKDATKKILSNIAKEADSILISDYAKGSITNDLMDYLKKWKQKMIIGPKPKNRDWLELYKNAHMIVPNQKEALEMSCCGNVYEAGIKLRKDLETNILITLAQEGMILFPKNEEKYLKIPTKVEEEYEATGAGDTAIAAISLATASGYSLEDAASIGNYAAGITIKKVGTYATTIEELVSVISKNSS